MTRPPQWLFSQYGSTDEQLTNLAADLKRLRASVATIRNGEVSVKFPVGNPKHRPQIDGEDNLCLSHPDSIISFIPYSLTPGSSTNAESSARNIEGTVILQYKLEDKDRSSRIDHVF